MEGISGHLIAYHAERMFLKPLIFKLSTCTSPTQQFTFKDIRRSCETLLASIGISSELRSHVLSHGRTGVQAKHYDRWSYLDEKRQVLEKWARHLQTIIARPEEGDKALQRAA